MNRPPPSSTLFPYPTLFRSHAKHRARAATSSECRNRRRCPPEPYGRCAISRENQNRRRSQTRVSEKKDRKSTRLNSSHLVISYAVFCLKKKKPPRTNESP